MDNIVKYNYFLNYYKEELYTHQNYESVIKQFINDYQFKKLATNLSIRKTKYMRSISECGHDKMIEYFSKFNNM